MRKQLCRIEAFHQKQLRELVGIVFPEWIRNERLYERTGAAPVGRIILRLARARWRLFGHVLRLPTDSPPPLAMGAYFAEPRPVGWWGRPRHTLPTLLHDYDKEIGLSLASRADLQAFRAFAADRSVWVSICAGVVICTLQCSFVLRRIFYLFFFFVPAWTFVFIWSGLCEHFLTRLWSRTP